MSKIGDILDVIKTRYTGSITSDDFPIDDRVIFRLVENTRAELLRQKDNKHQPINDLNYTRIILEFQLASIIECPELSQTSCKYFKSIKPAPFAVYSNNGSIEKGLDSLTYNQRFTKIEKKDLKNQSYKKYSGNILNWFQDEDGYVYFSCPLGPEKAVLTRVIEDYESYLLGYKDCLDILNEEYPLDKTLEHRLIEIVLKQMPQKDIIDETNDTKNEII